MFLGLIAFLLLPVGFAFWYRLFSANLAATRLDASVAAKAIPARAQIEPVIRGVIEKHARALATKKQQLMQVDAYGLRSTERWDAEGFNFFVKIIGRSASFS